MSGFFDFVRITVKATFKIMAEYFNLWLHWFGNSAHMGCYLLNYWSEKVGCPVPYGLLICLLFHFPWPCAFTICIVTDLLLFFFFHEHTFYELSHFFGRNFIYCVCVWCNFMKMCLLFASLSSLSLSQREQSRHIKTHTHTHTPFLIFSNDFHISIFNVAFFLL